MTGIYPGIQCIEHTFCSLKSDMCAFGLRDGVQSQCSMPNCGAV